MSNKISESESESIFVYKLGNNMLSIVMNSLVVRNNDIHHPNTRQNHHLRGSRPRCKTVVNSFTNRSAQIWNGISSKYKCVYIQI